MTDKSFGKLLDEIIIISKIKKNTLASYLKYDASYLSKWVHDTSLPSPKYIEVLCKEISTYIAGNACDESIESLGEILGLDGIDTSRAMVKDLISKELLSSYHMNKFDQTSPSPPLPNSNHFNTTTQMYPKNIAKSLVVELSKNMKMKPLDIIFSSDLGYLSDKILYLEILNELSRSLRNSNSRIRYVITNRSVDHDLVFNCIILTYIAISKPQCNSDIYVTNEDIKFSVAIAKDTLATISNYLSSDTCLSMTITREQEHLKSLYSTYDYSIRERCILLFKKYTIQQLLERKVYNNFILSSKISLVIGTLNELFLSRKMFDDLASQHFQPHELEFLQEINMLLHSISYKSQLRVLLRRVEIIKFVSTGVIHFFNKKIILSHEERIEYLKHLATLFENPNIDVKLVEKNIIDQLPDNNNFTLYASNSVVMSKNHVDSDISNFLVVQDKVIQDSYMQMFDQIWEDDTGRINHDKSEIIQLLNNMSRCSEFMR